MRQLRNRVARALDAAEALPPPQLTDEERAAGLLKLLTEWEQDRNKERRRQGEPVAASRLPELRALPAAEFLERFRRWWRGEGVLP